MSENILSAHLSETSKAIEYKPETMGLSPTKILSGRW